MSCPRALALSALAGLLLGGCGARTGLDVPDDDAGAEPDAPFGTFPCTYGRSGEAAPISTGWPMTVAPSLAWGAGLLAVTYSGRTDEALYDWVGLCMTGPESGLECEAPQVVGEQGGPGELVWNGDGFGLCWTEWGPEWHGVVLTRLDAEGRLIGQTRALEGAACLGMDWNGHGYTVAYASIHGDETFDTWIRGLDPSGAPSTELRLLTEVSSWFPFYYSVDADGEASAVVFSHDSTFAALGPPEAPTMVLLDGGPLGPLDVSVRDGRVALAWAEPGVGGSTEVRFAFVDEGGLGPSTLVASLDGEVETVSLHGVWDGYLTAWTERTAPAAGRTVVTPLRFGEGELMDVRREIVLTERVSDAPFPIALADDGHVAFAAYVALEGADGWEQVHLQLLACHR